MKIYAPHFLTFGILRNECCKEEDIIDCGHHLFNQNRIVFVATEDEDELKSITSKLAQADISLLHEVVTFKCFMNEDSYDCKKIVQMTDAIRKICGITTSIIFLHPDEYKDKGSIKMSVDIPEISFQLLTKYIEIEKG